MRASQSGGRVGKSSWTERNQGRQELVKIGAPLLPQKTQAQHTCSAPASACLTAPPAPAPAPASAAALTCVRMWVQVVAAQHCQVWGASILHLSLFPQYLVDHRSTADPPSFCTTDAPPSTGPNPPCTPLPASPVSRPHLPEQPAQLSEAPHQHALSIRHLRGARGAQSKACGVSIEQTG